MAGRSTFRFYLKTRQGVISLLLVVVCGLALAFFVGRTCFDPPPKVYHLDFGKAQWLEAIRPSPCNYFRKDIYISGAVDRGWIEISATDNFSLYVNNHRLDVRNFYGINVSGIYDLKKLLKIGKNTIAVSVSRISFPGSAQMIVRGSYGVRGCPLQEFVSDGTWRASNTPDGLVGILPWHATQLDDTFWSFAKEGSKDGHFSASELVTFDPRLLESVPIGHWIGASATAARQASFLGRVQLPGNRRETWLQVAATGDYDLIINGRLIVTQSFSTFSEAHTPAPQPFSTVETSGTVLQSQQPAAQAVEGASSPPVFSTAPLLLSYDISRWLHSGENTLVIRVRSLTQPATLLVDGYTVLPNRETKRFGSDGSWQQVVSGRQTSPAVTVADYGAQPWGELQQFPAGAVISPSYDFEMALTWGFVILGIEVALLLLWGIIPRLASIVLRYPPERLWTSNAVFHLCVLAVILLCWLLSFDVRFPNNWCYQPKLIIGLALLIAIGHLTTFIPRRQPGALRAEAPVTDEPPAVSSQSHRWARYWKVLAIAAVVVVGFCLRIHGLGTMSLDVDEMGVIQFSHGIQKRGYPFIQIGTFEREVTTYELVSYSIATARQFLGESEAACRTPSLIYGTLTIGLMALAGWRMMGWRVGLVASLVYALFPAGLYWARNAFWPSQDQFLALLSVWSFYEATRPGPLRRGFLTAATITFCLAYLTWEGSGFLLPVFFACIFVRRWGEYSWMKDWHLWRCCVFMSFVVLIQLTHRQVASLPIFLQTGNSLSEVTTPQLVPLDLTKFNPFYYFYWMLFAENYVVMTLLCILGILFCWRNPAIRYLFVLTALLIVCYTEFLPAYAVRYSYDYQATLILLAAGIFFKLWDAITSLDERWLKWCGAVALLALFLLGTNEFVLKAYRLSSNPTEAFYGERMGLYRADARTPAKFVAEHIRPGDGVVVAIPHMFEYYSGLKGDYSINTMLNNKITYDGTIKVPHYIDKFRGYPVVRGIEELEDLRTRYKRLWIVRTGATWSNPAVVQYLEQNSRVVYESYRSIVNLFDGQRDVGRQSY